MHKYELLILKSVRGAGKQELSRLMESVGLGKDETLWALENLKKQGFVEIEYVDSKYFALSDEGRRYAENGLPEERLAKKLGEHKIMVSELKSDDERIGMQWLKARGLIEIKNGAIKLVDAGDDAGSKLIKEGALLKEILSGNYTGNEDSLSDFIKRKLVAVRNIHYIKSVAITEAGENALGGKHAEMTDAIDRNIISSESWKNKEFKTYDVNVPIEKSVPAMRHPLKRIIEHIKDAYTSMGFQEISGPAVESSFWNFDSLFVPQDHPARDMQDTFYISNPEKIAVKEIEYMNRIKKAHRNAWHTAWKEDIASQMVLRAHTTSVSARYVYDIMNAISKGAYYDFPIRLFSVGRVFRNEAIDYKHLADLYQMDGLIIGKNLTMSNLFDTLKRIYDSMGIKINFKPSYFPFVEPGAEFYAQLPGSDSAIELGGAGMLREEITGMKRNRLSALAWGAGIERILLVKDTSIKSLPELYNNNMGWLRKRRLI